MNSSSLKLKFTAIALAVCALFSSRLSGDTFILDFDSIATDIFGQETGAFDHSTYGFTGMNNADVQLAVLTAVTDHFLSYPTVSQDPNSPLPDGFELDWNFEIGTVGNGPSNGDTEYYYIKIGTGLSGSNATNQNVFGAACLSCVRNAAGNGPNFGVQTGDIVGAVWTDHIDNIANLASNNSQLVNLIAGTTSHEIGHTFSLEHAGAQDDNPGQSAWGVMGSGATSMPNNQRVLDREFTYNKFGQLIGAIGLRSSPIPEPSTFVLMVFGSCALIGVRRRKQN